MASFRSVIGIGLVSAMIISAPVFASTPQHSAASAAVARPVLRTPVKQAVATPAQTKVAAPAHKAAKQPSHLAKATLRNGKKVTYDCSLAGNKTKEACKG